MEEKSIFRIVIEFFTNRVVILFFVTVLLFLFIVLRLFDLQIVNGHKFLAQVKPTKTEETVIDAPRGAIYDKFGRPLAVNAVAYSVKIDDTILVDRVEDKNRSVLDLIEILNANDEKIIDELPITKAEPRRFMFDGNQSRERRWKLDMGLEDKAAGLTTKEIHQWREKTGKEASSSTLSEDEREEYLMALSAEECYEYLTNDLFKIPEGLPAETERMLVSIRQSLRLSTWNYTQVTIARNVKEKTIAMIEEQKHKFPGVLIDVEPLRVYPEGELFAHIVGYIRSITSDQYKQYEPYGYTPSDVVGQLGIEKATELSLKGKSGKKTLEVDYIGRVVSSETTQAATPGDKVFLTIDTDFQEKCAKILRDTLRDAIVTRLDGKVKDPLTIKDLCKSTVSSNKKIIEAAYYSDESSPELYRIRQTFIDETPDFVVLDNEKLKEVKEVLSEAIETNSITPKTVVLAMFEAGILKGTDNYIDSIKNGRRTPLSVIREKLLSDELEPSDTGADPCTGGLAVMDVKTGAVLALVTYPTYDNNEFVNGFNIDYYNELLFDEQAPLINRPLMTRKAPGSTFKMVSATAVLEEGIVTPRNTIGDLYTFTKAGTPYANCNSSHGAVNVSTAIEVSCNYFFYDAVFRLGNASLGSTVQGITTLARYMSYFGLTDETGIEIEETSPRYASPAYKSEVVRSINPNAPEYETRWMDGDTIRAAIGQSYNSFSPANMAKYIATLANGGTRYKTHVIGRVDDYYSNYSKITEPVAENILEIDEENLSTIYRGMYGVTAGARGTARGIFAGFPIAVAGKTGTAEEAKDRLSHTWFVGFAPYDSPEISVAVMLPFGESVPSPSAVIARNVIGEYFQVEPRVDAPVYESHISR